MINHWLLVAPNLVLMSVLVEGGFVSPNIYY